MALDTLQLEDLRALVGKNVRVAISEDGFSRNHFGPQIGLAGTLESHKSKPDAYRVVVSDDTYTYFTPDNVVLVNLLSSVPTIMIKIDVKLGEK